MWSFLALLARSRDVSPSAAAHGLAGDFPADGTALRLFETAEARAGLDPQQAQELRRAASAYLSVVR